MLEILNLVETSCRLPSSTAAASREQLVWSSPALAPLSYFGGSLPAVEQLPNDRSIISLEICNSYSPSQAALIGRCYGGADEIDLYIYKYIYI
jgi:hypothetical protein